MTLERPQGPEKPSSHGTPHRLFVDASLAPGEMVALNAAQANYLLSVLRLANGARILVFNGKQGEFAAKLTTTSRRAANLAIEHRERGQPAASSIVYAFAPLKHARLDYMVQKAVEMGAGCLAPVITRRTQVSRVNTQRMRANAIEAAEQCGILCLPDIRPDCSFDAFLVACPNTSPVIFCDEEASVSDPIASLGTVKSPLTILVGPEGGFDPIERQALLKRPNVLRVSLGPRILRADTAAVAVLALVQAAIGDWRQA